MEVRLQLNAYGKSWLALCGLLALGSVVCWLVPAPWFDWQPSLASSQPWRWWTAAFVHWSETHLLANLLGLLVVAVLGRVAQVPAVVALAWLVSWPLLHLALLMQPALAHYGGLSGVLHAGVAVVATFVAATRTVAARGVALAMLVGLVVKVVSETPWGAPLQQVQGWDIAVAPLAHASGLVLGVLMTLLVLARDGFASHQGLGKTSTTSNQLDQNKGLR